MKPGNGEKAPVKLFISTNASNLLGGGGTQAQVAQQKLTPSQQQKTAAPQKTAVFAETDDIIILRTVNGLLLHMADILATEVITHVEFLRLPSNVVALGVVALARCLTGKDPAEAKAVIMFIVKSLGVSASQALASAELLKDKYKEALTGGAATADGSAPTAPCTLPQPTVSVPDDISERLKFVFGK
eukprot:GILJ01026519.1.p1 GENE.GILJ01026519.1~~GILJ01026519.1.p1  ORF type:complete len:187 (+),score=41.30 GILJ01026519.1:314-874(+)